MNYYDFRDRMLRHGEYTTAQLKGKFQQAMAGNLHADVREALGLNAPKELRQLIVPPKPPETIEPWVEGKERGVTRINGAWNRALVCAAVRQGFITRQQLLTKTRIKREQFDYTVAKLLSCDVLVRKNHGEYSLGPVALEDFENQRERVERAFQPNIAGGEIELHSTIVLWIVTRGGRNLEEIASRSELTRDQVIQSLRHLKETDRVKQAGSDWVPMWWKEQAEGATA